MRELGIHGALRAKTRRTAVPGQAEDRPADLVERQFGAPAPNRLWLADLTYVWTVAGFCYIAFVIAFSRAVVGWRVSRSLAADLALDALEMAIYSRCRDDLAGLVHHSYRGVQYLSIRYTKRLEQAGAASSVGSKGDSYDNAAAETVIGLYKTELIRRRGSWRSPDDVELGTLGGSTGGTTADFMELAAISRRPSLKPTTIVSWRRPANHQSQSVKSLSNPGRFTWCTR
jgi:putative transposase